MTINRAVSLQGRCRQVKAEECCARRLQCTGREQARPVMKDGEADDFKREEDAVGKVC